jgi:membrane protein DedA with SNARE-associated domain
LEWPPYGFGKEGKRNQRRNIAKGEMEVIQEKLLTFILHYGYVGIFGSLVLGIIGLPIPDEFLMSFAGYLVAKGELNYFFTVLVASLGSITGMTISFFIGHKFGLSFIEKNGDKFHVTKAKLERLERWFNRFGKFAVTIGYFVPGIRHITAFSAGLSKWRYNTFLLYAMPGGFIWVLTFVNLGVFLKEHWRVFTESLHKYLLLTMLLMIIILGIWWIVESMTRLK